jgi:hypothetical protein
LIHLTSTHWPQLDSRHKLTGRKPRRALHLSYTSSSYRSFSCILVPYTPALGGSLDVSPSAFRTLPLLAVARYSSGGPTPGLDVIHASSAASWYCIDPLWAVLSMYLPQCFRHFRSSPSQDTLPGSLCRTWTLYKFLQLHSGPVYTRSGRFSRRISFSVADTPLLAVARYSSGELTPGLDVIHVSSDAFWYRIYSLRAVLSAYLHQCFRHRTPRRRQILFMGAYAGPGRYTSLQLHSDAVYTRPGRFSRCISFSVSDISLLAVVRHSSKERTLNSDVLPAPHSLRGGVT